VGPGWPPSRPTRAAQRSHVGGVVHSHRVNAGLTAGRVVVLRRACGARTVARALKEAALQELIAREDKTVDYVENSVPPHRGTVTKKWQQCTGGLPLHLSGRCLPGDAISSGSVPSDARV
jgi:hypothetical protein